MDSTTLDQLDAWRRKRTLSSARGISTIRRSETKWIQIQHRTFAKWVSQQTGVQVENFKIDFVDGTVFLKLMEVLSGKSVKRYHLFPQSITQRCDNVQLALDICKSQDVRLTNIGAHDIANGSLKLILGLVWCLIQRYHLISIYESQKSRDGSKDDTFKIQVIRGLNKILDKLKLRVNNIKGDWKDGMALTALVTYLAPAFNRDFMNIERGEYVSATEAAMEAAQKHLDIPRLLTAEDFTSEEVDELSMITYLSYFLHPSHRAVRELYLQEHADYVPRYKPYIEPQQDTSQDKKSPIKKLFSTYKEKLKKVRTNEDKFYKEPYKISDRYEGGGVIPPGPLKSGGVIPPGPLKSGGVIPPGPLKSGGVIPLGPMKSGGVISPGPIKPTGLANHLLTEVECGTVAQLEKIGTRSEAPSGTRSEGTRSEAPSGTRSEAAAGTGSVIRHHKTIRRRSKNQCDVSQCDKTWCSPENETCPTCTGQEISTVIEEEEECQGEEEEEMSEVEKEEILEKIFNATSEEDLLSIDEKEEEEGGTMNRFRRSNTTVQRNRNRSAVKSSDNAAPVKPSELQPFFRDHEVLAEYKLLCNNVSSGVYVVPSLKSLQVWNGMIFIKIGMFADGCFKFNMFIPDNFPYGRPSLRFVTPVFHPQIKENGELNLSKAFPTWTPRKDRIWHLMRYTKRCFFSVNTFDATNVEAAGAIHQSIETFRKRARLCVRDSIRLNTVERVNSDEDEEDMFNVKLLSPTQIHIFKDKLLQGTVDYSTLFQ